MKKPARPAPPAEMPSAKRLEDVRAWAGVPSLRGFWQQLAENWMEGRVSYEAVRNYHYDREAPAAYLARVAKVFNVSLVWLITGDDHMTAAHGVAADAAAAARPAGDWHRDLSLQLERAVRQEMGVPVPSPPLRELVSYWLAPLAEVWLRRRSTFRPSPTSLIDWSQDEQQFRAMGVALKGPLDAFGFNAANMNERDLGDYIVAMTPALFVLMAIRDETQLIRGITAIGRLVLNADRGADSTNAASNSPDAKEAPTAPKKSGRREGKMKKPRKNGR